MSTKTAFKPLTFILKYFCVVLILSACNDSNNDSLVDSDNDQDNDDVFSVLASHEFVVGKTKIIAQNEYEYLIQKYNAEDNAFSDIQTISSSSSKKPSIKLPESNDKIAYALDISHDDGLHDRLYVTNSDGSINTEVIPSIEGGVIEDFHWALDGESILYLLSFSETHKQIRLVDADGDDDQMVFDSEDLEGDQSLWKYFWESQTNRLAVMVSDEGNVSTYQLFIYHTDSDEVLPLGHIDNTTIPNSPSASWSFDGSYFAYFSESSLVVYQLSTGTAQTKNNASLMPVVWANHSNQLLWVESVNEGENFHVHRLNAETSENQQMNAELLEESVDRLAWSYDDAEVIYSAGLIVDNPPSNSVLINDLVFSDSNTTYSVNSVSLELDFLRQLKLSIYPWNRFLMKGIAPRIGIRFSDYLILGDHQTGEIQDITGSFKAAGIEHFGDSSFGSVSDAKLISNGEKMIAEFSVNGETVISQYDIASQSFTVLPSEDGEMFGLEDFLMP